MNAHALSVLEFPRVRELVAERAATGAGAAKVRSLEPRHDREWLEQEHSRVSAMRSLVESEAGWRSEAIPDIEQGLSRLRVEGATLQATELFSIGRLLSTPPSTSRRPLRESGGTRPGIDMLAPTASVTLPRRWTTSRLESRSALTVKSGFTSSSIVISPNRRSNIFAALRDRISATRGSV